MAVVQELVAKFRADLSDFTSKVNQAKKDIDSVGKTAKRMGGDVQSGAAVASEAMSLLSDRATQIKGAVIAASVAVGAFSIKVGSDMDSAAKRIEGMLGSAERANQVISQLRESAYVTGASIISLSDSYSKLATFVENGSVSLAESIELQKGLTNTAAALGAGNEQLSQVMFGLSQALGSGIVRAEEFNQVTEPLPGIINKIEEASGLATGELRKMINDGLITSDMFKQMLIPALQSFEAKALEMADTLKVQQGVLSNTFIAIGQDIYDYLESPLSSAIKRANEFLQTFVSVKRASKEELGNRLSELQKEEKNLGKGEVTNTYFGGVKITKFKNVSPQEIQARKAEIDKQKAEIYAARNPELMGGVKDLLAGFAQGGTPVQKSEPAYTVSPELAEQLKTLRSAGGAKKVTAARAGGSRVVRGVRTEAERQAQEAERIKASAIAEAKQSIATAQAEVDTMRLLSHEKKIAIDLNKLEAVGVAENSKQYKELADGLTKAYTAEARMRETLDLEEYTRNKERETQALQDNAVTLGMTADEIQKYNIQRALQNDLDDKSRTLTTEGFENYKRVAESMADVQMRAIEQNKAYEESFAGGWAKITKEARENAITEADLITSGYDIMSSNIADTLVGMANGTKSSFKDMARSIITDIQSIITRALVMRAITGLVNTFTAPAAPSTAGTGFLTETAGFSFANAPQFGGARANGGRLRPNMSYIVGERGPERITTDSVGGYVTPNHKMGSGSGTVINIDARGAAPGVEQSIRNVFNELASLKKQVPNIAIAAVKNQNTRSLGFIR